MRTINSSSEVAEASQSLRAVPEALGRGSAAAFTVMRAAPGVVRRLLLAARMSQEQLQTLCQRLAAGWQDEDADALGIRTTNLLRALPVDLQHHIPFVHPLRYALPIFLHTPGGNEFGFYFELFVVGHFSVVLKMGFGFHINYTQVLKIVSFFNRPSISFL